MLSCELWTKPGSLYPTKTGQINVTINQVQLEKGEWARACGGRSPASGVSRGRHQVEFSQARVNMSIRFLIYFAHKRQTTSIKLSLLQREGV